MASSSCIRCLSLSSSSPVLGPANPGWRPLGPANPGWRPPGPANPDWRPLGPADPDWRQLGPANPGWRPLSSAVLMSSSSVAGEGGRAADFLSAAPRLLPFPLVVPTELNLFSSSDIRPCEAEKKVFKSRVRTVVSAHLRKRVLRNP